MSNRVSFMTIGMHMARVGLTVMFVGLPVAFFLSESIGKYALASGIALIGVGVLIDLWTEY